MLSCTLLAVEYPILTYRAHKCCNAAQNQLVYRSVTDRHEFREGHSAYGKKLDMFALLAMMCTVHSLWKKDLTARRDVSDSPVLVTLRQNTPSIIQDPAARPETPDLSRPNPHCLTAQHLCQLVHVLPIDPVLV